MGTIVQFPFHWRPNTVKTRACSTHAGASRPWSMAKFDIN
jgi:hypothetical protein